MSKPIGKCSLFTNTKHPKSLQNKNRRTDQLKPVCLFTIGALSISPIPLLNRTCILLNIGYHQQCRAAEQIASHEILMTTYPEYITLTAEEKFQFIVQKFLLLPSTFLQLINKQKSKL